MIGYDTESAAVGEGLARFIGPDVPQYRLALDPEKAREFRLMSEDYDKAVCTMCGTLCSMQLENTRAKLGELLTAPEEEATHRHVRVGSRGYRERAAPAPKLPLGRGGEA